MPEQASERLTIEQVIEKMRDMQSSPSGVMTAAQEFYYLRGKVAAYERSWKACWPMGKGTPMVRRVCAWCGRTMGWRFCEWENFGDVSHGICEDCERKFWEAE